jgi:hypothetical protein
LILYEGAGEQRNEHEGQANADADVCAVARAPIDDRSARRWCRDQEPNPERHLGQASLWAEGLLDIVGVGNDPMTYGIAVLSAAPRAD